MHDEVLLDMDRLHTLPPPIVFERRGLRGFPVFAILVDDIPQEMVLRQAGDYMIEVYKSLPQVTYAKIKKQELIKLQGGLNANYVEIELRYQSRKIYSVCVLAYKNNKIIGTVVGGERGTPIEDLAVMAKSLKFEK